MKHTYEACAARASNLVRLQACTCARIANGHLLISAANDDMQTVDVCARARNKRAMYSFGAPMQLPLNESTCCACSRALHKKYVASTEWPLRRRRRHHCFLSSRLLAVRTCVGRYDRVCTHTRASMRALACEHSLACKRGNRDVCRSVFVYRCVFVCALA